jgi:hypothetical protein
MRAGEDPGNKNPANTTAREQAFARLVKLLKEMKPAHAANRSKTGELARKSAGREPSCHGAATVPAT